MENKDKKQIVITGKTVMKIIGLLNFGIGTGILIASLLGGSTGGIVNWITPMATGIILFFFDELWGWLDKI
ncbi:MAG: hypothetical protein FWE83_06675 [Oscillospiraceae bacterium]|jgi:hypothetical protein|nr:hypothetical protein [Oscillospiraceae bacterium]